MTEQRGGPYAGIGPDGLLYAIGGVIGPPPGVYSDQNPKLTNTYESFSFVTNSWTARGSLPADPIIGAVTMPNGFDYRTAWPDSTGSNRGVAVYVP
jgi:hypothetical protein